MKKENKDIIKNKIEKIKTVLKEKQKERSLQSFKIDLLNEVKKIRRNIPKDGYTPRKGKDYFDGKDGYIPTKGKDYFDGKDGKTPVKGEDYFTDAEVKMVIDLAMQGFKIDSKQIIKLLSDKNLKYEDRLSVLALKDLNRLNFFSPGGVAGNGGGTGGSTTLAGLTDVNLTGLADGNMLIWNQATLKWIVAIPTDTDEKVKYDAGDLTAGYLADKFVAGTGITLTEGTGADENKLKITNSAPDQTVSISAGTNITSVTGTYPNFTINAATQTTDISGLVPYTGATTDVDLGDYNLKADGVISHNSHGFYLKTQSLANSASFGLGGSQAWTFYDGVKLDAGTASRVLVTDSNKNIAYTTMTAADLDAIPTTYAKLDGSNQPFTGNVGMTKTTPVFTLTNSGAAGKIFSAEVNNSTDDILVKATSGEVAVATYSAANSGSTNRFNVANYANFDVDTGTVAVWFKSSTGSGNQHIISYGYGAASESNQKAFIKLATGKVVVYVQGGMTWTSTNTYSDGNWHLVVWGNNADGNFVRIDGAAGVGAYTVGSASTDTFFGDATSVNYMAFGNGVAINVYNVPLIGNFDDFAFWTRKLTTDEADELWASGNGKYWNLTDTFTSSGETFSTNLIGYWRFDGDGVDATGTNNATNTGCTYDTPKIQGTNTDIIGTVIKVQDGVSASERGIYTLGNYSGAKGSRNVLEGLSHRINILGTEYSQFNATGLLSIDNYQHIFGSASDANIIYDGTNLVVSPAAVGTGFVQISKAGTAKANSDFLAILNTTQAADMDGTASGLLWQHRTTAPAIVSSGRIAVGTETDWTSTASTQDSYMSFQNALDGVLAEKMRIDSKGGIDWTNGNIWYVPIGGDIEAYTTAATAGDTIILAAGTYTPANSIDISKALNIVGQGMGQTTVSAAAFTNIFNVTSSNVSIRNMSITNTYNGTGRAVYFDGTGGTVLTNCRLRNVAVTVSGTGAKQAVTFNDAGGTLWDVDITTTSSDNVSYGVLAQVNASAEANATVNVYSSRVTTTASTNAYAFYANDSSATNDIILNIYNTYGTASGGSANYGIQAAGGTDALVYAYSSQLNGSTADVSVANSATLQLTNCVLVNNTTTGTTITYGGNLRSATARFGNTTIGFAEAGTDYTLTFDGETNDGLLTWMEDEDYFKFSDGILMDSTEEIFFRDTALKINSIDDGHLDLTADVSIDLNATVDAGANIIKTTGAIRGIHKTADDTAAVADGTYTVGIGGTQNGTITIKDGVITAVQQAI
jgi:hypothetical protein